MRGDLQLHSVCLRVLVCNCERKQREDEDVLGWAVCQAGKPAGEFSKSMAKKAAKGQPAKCTVCVANPPANNPPAAAAAAAVRHPEPKVSTPAHTKHLGWCVGFEFRVMRNTGTLRQALSGRRCRTDRRGQAGKGPKSVRETAGGEI